MLDKIRQFFASKAAPIDADIIAAHAAFRRAAESEEYRRSLAKLEGNAFLRTHCEPICQPAALGFVVDLNDSPSTAVLVMDSAR